MLFRSDNLEITIEDLTVGKSSDNKMIPEKITIIKGGLLKDIKGSVKVINSNEGKVQQDSTYINIISTLALKEYMDMSNAGIFHTNSNISLTCSLPPKDTQSGKRKDDFKNRLAGSYKVDIPRVGFSITVNVLLDKIEIEDESKAVMRYWRSFIEKNLSDDDTVLVMDGGGSTIDLAVLQNGRLITAASKSLQFGGVKLLEKILEKYTGVTGEMPPKDDQTKENVIERGYLKDGAVKISMKDYTDKDRKSVV